MARIHQLVFLSILACSSSARAQPCAPIQPQSLVEQPWTQLLGFGTAVDHEGSRAVIGGPGRSGAWMEGAAWVMEEELGTWRERAFLQPSERAMQFGYAVALYEDYLAVGAPAFFPQGQTGKVFLYHFNGTEWIERAVLTSPAEEPGDSFGYSVAVSESALVVGAPGASGRSGNAYLFPLPIQELEGGILGVLSLRDHITQSLEEFGHSVTASGRFAAASGTRFGPVAIFERGVSWHLVRTLQSPEGWQSLYFGRSIALHESQLVVGNYKGGAGGVAHVFSRHDSGVWQEVAVLESPDPEHTDRFAWTVDVAEGRIGVAPRTGQISVFRGEGSTWDPAPRLVEPCDGGFRRDLSVGQHSVLVGSVAANAIFALDERGTSTLADPAAVTRDFGVEAFPNPSTGGLTLIARSPSAVGSTVEILDVLGRRVGRVTLSGRQTRVETQDYARGLYLLVVTGRDGAQLTTWVKR
ncbi:MAG: T9SS type A sorting domain-containing protein [Rhodothermales bacterium]|nr:T9SS type A sorting domain-containing protein [Rhodothermales bacterium]MBO6780851.1 T9SS type A sorting domain-containing protein [Rhodothermales bacterium]